jgi:hypothetical protein
MQPNHQTTKPLSNQELSELARISLSAHDLSLRAARNQAAHLAALEARIQKLENRL